MLAFQLAIQAYRLVAAVGQAHAGAAGQVLPALLADVVGQTGPQHGDHRAAAVVLVHAGATHLDDVIADARQADKVEFVFGIQAGQRARLGRRQHAVGAHHLAAGVVFHDQVVAVGVVIVTVDAFRGAGQLCAHFAGKYLVAQLLRAADVLVAAGEADAEFAGRSQQLLFAEMLHAAFP